MLSVGIIGLPNVGKSTLFNALTAGHAEVSNYPFTTIASNLGVVPVPDERLERLRQALRPEKTTPCAIRFIDIAGLVAGASRGEGLGNQFLGEIRQTDAVAHVVRCFRKTDVAHVYADVDPVRDVGVIDTELMLADLEVLGKAVAKRARDWQTRPREHATEKERMLTWRDSLERGVPLRRLDLRGEERRELKTAGLLTGKPVLYVANVASGEEDLVRRLRELEPTAEVVAVDAELELELGRMDAQERSEFMRELELSEPGRHRLVRAAFRLLGLVTFYTVVKGKLQAWEVPGGTAAPQAAGKVHSDMERGFIRAHVVTAEALISAGGMGRIQAGGHVRTVGKDYEVQDGDVMEFLFSAP